MSITTTAVEKASVLIVEDEADIQYALKHVLEKAGYRVVACRNGDEALEIVRLMNSEDTGVAAAVARAAAPIAAAIDVIAERLRAGGRLVYIGAGTSGRLGVLDASECPPTFNSPPWQVVGLIAGGQFHSLSNVPAENIARWDGFRWRPLGAGTDAVALTTFTSRNRHELLVSGIFDHAGGEPAVHFAFLAKLAGDLGLPELSMGMSGDFETAAQFGATYVRVGSAIFGTR